MHGVKAPALWHLVGHPPQVTHFDRNDSTFSAKSMIMNVPCKLETTAFQGQKENRTREQSFNITSMKFFWQVRWIDQIQYPISLVASLDAVPVICCAPLLFQNTLTQRLLKWFQMIKCLEVQLTRSKLKASHHQYSR